MFHFQNLSVYFPSTAVKVMTFPLLLWKSQVWVFRKPNTGILWIAIGNGNGIQNNKIADLPGQEFEVCLKQGTE